MIVLSDNDVILKLAQCNLLSQLPVIFNQPPEQIFINPAARFQLLPRNIENAIRKFGGQNVYEQVDAFIATVQDIPEVQNTQLIELLGSVPGIDVGEQLLLASCIENPEAIFMTGDRRCLSAIVANQPALDVIHQRLMDAVITFESSLLLCVNGLTQARVYAHLMANPLPDGMLRMALANAGHTMCECIFSYTREFYDYLAFKDRLPVRDFGL
ncbi:hypothetical protein O1V64_04255 [Rouxiella badensis]|uniref:Uncharacterized protein n=1 Tax=Rouxiella badensis TaxID=1646377 RepID=A0A1X0WAJ8_9GAMM|nr:hypothetical protein [Rouxiella badensis]ORJ23735.1 hypothetical protein BS640_19980 [Rouxiella badensis]WAT05523.1 hypothetical protein O1V64_04255 [Rouxiella badensis]